MVHSLWKEASCYRICYPTAWRPGATMLARLAEQAVARRVRSRFPHLAHWTALGVLTFTAERRR
jgi:hypothetical protein